jgi:GT2 family glycosyltransferase
MLNIGRSLPEISVVVNSRDDARFNTFEVKFLKRLDFAPERVVRISDAKSMSEGYNRGYRLTNSEWIMFVHDDIELLTPRVSRVLSHALRGADVVGVCGTRRLSSGNWYDSGVPYNCGSIVQPDPVDDRFHRYDRFGCSSRAIVRDVQAMDGVFIMVRRRVLDALSGFDEVNYTDFHTYDIDFTFRSYLAGLRCVVARDVLLRHKAVIAEYSEAKVMAWHHSQARFVELFGHNLNS